MSILAYELNPFGGAVIDEAALSHDPALFSQSLQETLSVMRKEGLNVIWLHLPISYSELVDIAVKEGFLYHHADEAGIQLFCRLVEGAFVPGYATHYLGAGGVVVDDENRILIIQEKHHTRKHYKLPGGALDPGEHISDAVVREVREETGIECEFVSLNCFRHWHGYRYGKSDIYFVCRLKALSSEITIDPSEIAEAQWMPVDEYLNHPDTHPFNKKIVETTLSSRGLMPEDIEDYGTPETHEMLF